MSISNDQEKIIAMRQVYDVKLESEKNTLGRHLSKARKGKGWSIKAMTEKLATYNIHIQPAAVNKWELGLTTPNAYQVFALCRLLEIEDGVRYFSGPLSPSETALNEQGLKKVKDYREDLIASGRYSFVAPDEDFEEELERPIYELPVSAGTGNFLDGDNYRMESFKKSTVPLKADFALTVSGDSMTPNYTNGQMVWVQESPELLPSEIGIFVLNGSAYMKMYTEVDPDENNLEDFRRSDGVICPKITLVSLNKKYDPIPVGEFDEFRIIGRVLTR